LDLDYAQFASIRITREFALTHGLDPRFQPRDVPESVYSSHVHRLNWEQNFKPERLTKHNDPTFRAATVALAQGSYRKPCPVCGRKRGCECAAKVDGLLLALGGRAGLAPEAIRRAMLRRTPIHDLLFTVRCSDGEITFGRRALMQLNSAAHLGLINVRHCTTSQVRALVEGGAR
jgi:hypothetical protein